MAEINSLADLRPGDIMFGPIGGLVPGVFPVAVGQLMLGDTFRIGRLSVRHAGIVVGDRRLVQAMPHGAEEIDMTDATHWTDRHVYVRLVEDYPGQSYDAATVARMFVAKHVRYSFASYVALAAWSRGLKTPRLERWIDRRRPPMEVELHRNGFPLARDIALPAEAICSVLVDQAWTLAGHRVMQGVPHQAVTPGAMAGQLWRRRGAVWGGKALLS